MIRSENSLKKDLKGFLLQGLFMLIFFVLFFIPAILPTLTTFVKKRIRRLLSDTPTIQTRKVLFALWCFLSVLVLKQFVFELFCMYSLCFYLIVLSFYCQQLILHLSKFISRQSLFIL